MPTIVDRGLTDYQTLQRREDGTATAHLAGRCDARDGTPVEARVLHGERPLPYWDWRPVARSAQGSWDATLPGIPTGGPYRIELRSGDSEGDATHVDKVLVGDLWFLGGQSNMEGCGVLKDFEAPSPLVHSFTSAERWAIAEEPLHWLCDSIDQCHTDQAEPQKTLGAAETRRNRMQGVGPGLPFAKEMVARTGVPIGLVPCAHGGTSMEQWSPALRDQAGASLYGSMYRRLQVVGGRARGMLWYQGESDAAPGPAEVYEQELGALVAAVRRDFGDEHLPFVLVQIGRWVADAGRDVERAWGRVREAQRTLPERVAGIALATAIDMPIDDGIHISTEGQRRIGQRLATAVCSSILRHPGVAAGPQPVSARAEPGYPVGAVRVTFGGVNGRLRAAGRVTGFSIRSPRGRDLWLVFHAELDSANPNDVLLRLNEPVPTGASLWYGWGVDPYCNVTDDRDMAVPAFGPMAIDGAG